MANKNLSQLPTNATPQETDWLLGASGSSPAVFQKIPVGAIVPAQNSGGSIKFSLPINENIALTSSGYYFTDNIAASIGIDCSGLGIGDHISWVNLSTKAVIFYGLTSVNTTTIPANKGVRIEANTSIEFFLKDANFNARVLAGSYTLSWIPGQEPIGQYLPFTSTATLDGVVNWLGTNFGTSSFSNPYPSLITITGRTLAAPLINLSPGPSPLTALTNKSTSDSLNFYNAGLTSTSADAGVFISFPSGKTLLPERVAVFFDNNQGSGRTINLILKGQKTDDSFETLGTVSCPYLSNQFVVFTCSTSSRFKAIFIHAPYIYHCFFREFEAWGYYG